MYTKIEEYLYGNVSGAFYIPGNVPSSKNSKEIIYIYTGRSSCCNAKYIKSNGKFICMKCRQVTTPGKRPVLSESKLTKEYKEKTSLYYSSQVIRELFDLKKPIGLGMFFIRSSKHHYDFINASQVICDILVKNNVIDDDDTQNVIPIFLGEKYDKEEPGVVLYPFPYYNLFIHEAILQKGINANIQP